MVSETGREGVDDVLAVNVTMLINRCIHDILFFRFTEPKAERNSNDDK